MKNILNSIIICWVSAIAYRVAGCHCGCKLGPSHLKTPWYLLCSDFLCSFYCGWLLIHCFMIYWLWTFSLWPNYSALDWNCGSHCCILWQCSYVVVFHGRVQIPCVVESSTHPNLCLLCPHILCCLCHFVFHASQPLFSLPPHPPLPCNCSSPPYPTVTSPHHHAIASSTHLCKQDLKLNFSNWKYRSIMN